jgi:uncharacterized protein (UPF0332 family)
MAIVNSKHLLDQADRLLRPGDSIRYVRQADRRRAISAAYYAVFHFTLTALADEFVGKTERRTARYALAYRSVDHGTLTKLCKNIGNPNTLANLSQFAPEKGFGPNILEFASLVAQLKEKRTAADYDPTLWVTLSDARKAIDEARSAMLRFGKATVARRRAFLSLLIFSAGSR